MLHAIYTVMIAHTDLHASIYTHPPPHNHQYYSKQVYLLMYLSVTDIELGECSEPSLLVAKLLSQLKSMTEGQKPSPSSLVVTGEGLPALTWKCVDKILAGEYIDFTELPPAKGKFKSIPSTVEGQMGVVQAADLLESRQLIPDLATWVQCFGVYTVVITSKDPSCMKNMLAYLALIAKFSQKYRWPSWVIYDQNFGQEAAEKGCKDWSKVDPSIHAQCFTGASISQENWCKRCYSIDHASDNCPIKPYAASRKREGPLQVSAPPKKRPAPHSNPAVCRKYNLYNGDCKFGEACKFQHKCEKCGEHGHPVSKCTKLT